MSSIGFGKKKRDKKEKKEKGEGKRDKGDSKKRSGTDGPHKGFLHGFKSGMSRGGRKSSSNPAVLVGRDPFTVGVRALDDALHTFGKKTEEELEAVRAEVQEKCASRSRESWENIYRVRVPCLTGNDLKSVMREISASEDDWVNRSMVQAFINVGFVVSLEGNHLVYGDETLYAFTSNESLSKLLPPSKNRHVASSFSVLRHMYGLANSDIKVAFDHFKNRVQCVRVVQSDDQNVMNAARSSATLWQNLEHPGIAKFYGKYDLDHGLATAFEPLFGGLVFHRLAGERMSSEVDLARIILQIAQALQYLHGQDLAFRNISPYSIMFVGAPKTEVKLFGLENVGGAGTPVGPQHRLFTPPELVIDNQDGGMAGDIWSLGALMFTLLVGYPPFNPPADKSTIKQLMYNQVPFKNKDWAHVSHGAKACVTAMLDRDPGARPTAKSLQEFPFLKLAAGKPVTYSVTERDPDAGEITREITLTNQTVEYSSHTWFGIENLDTTEPFHEGGATSSNGPVPITRSSSSTGSIKKEKRRKNSGIDLPAGVDLVGDTVHLLLGGLETDTTKLRSALIRSLAQGDPTSTPWESRTSFTIDNVRYNMHTPAVGTATWDPSFEAAFAAVFVVDLAEPTKDENYIRDGSMGCGPSLERFKTFISNPLFGDKDSLKDSNMPIMLIFQGMDIFRQNLAQQKNKKLPFSSEADAEKFIESLFMAPMDASKIPRHVGTHFSGLDPFATTQFIVRTVNEWLTTPRSGTVQIEAAAQNQIASKENLLMKMPERKLKVKGPKPGIGKEIDSLLESIIRRKCKITKVNLSNNNLDGTAMQKLSQGLAQNSSILHLNLSSNPLGDNGVSELCYALSKNSTLKELILQNVDMHAGGLLSLAGLLSRNSTIELVDISFNMLSLNGADALRDGLRSNQTLRTLIMYSCSLNHASGLALAALFEEHPALEILNLKKNSVSIDFGWHLSSAIKRASVSSLSDVDFGTTIWEGPPFEAVDKAIAEKKKDVKKKEKWEKKPQSESLTHTDAIASKSAEKKGSVVLRCFSLSNLPKSMSQGSLLSSLQVLDLCNNSFVEIPAAVFNMKGLKSINMSRNSIKAIPVQLYDMATLCALDLSHNKIADIPSGLSKLTGLQHLMLQFNLLTKLPPEVFKMPRISRLLVNNNEIVDVPSDVFVMSSLNDFNARNNPTDQVRVSIMSAWAAGQPMLDLSHNNLETLPREFAQLANLQHLMLNDNNFVNLPPQIGNLANLISLNLANNKISSLMNIVTLKNLKRIDVTNNPLEDTSLVGMPAQQIIARLQEKRNKKVPAFRCKLMIVGNAGVGKSSVARWLSASEKDKKKKKKLFDEVRPTDGIDIMSWTHVTGSKQEVTFSVWDFSGQEVYHPSHSFFLASRSIFLVVFDLTIPEEKQKIKIWLQMIKSSAPDAPIILVGTHLEDKKCTPDYINAVASKFETKYISEFSNIQRFVACSTVGFRNLDDLKQKIISVAAEQSHMGEEVPASYMDMEKLVIQKRPSLNPPLVPMAEFERMAISCGSTQTGKTVAEFLTAIGTVLYFDEKKLGFGSTVILDPLWMIGLICTIITSEHNLLTEGRLYHRNLKRIWTPPDYPESSHDQLISVFDKVELAFRVEDEGDDKGPYSIVPSMLQDKRPLIEGTWIALDEYLVLAENKQLERNYCFRFLPFGFFSRLLVRLLHFGRPVYMWKNGILLEKKPEIALIEFEPYSLEVELKVRGTNPARLLRLLVENIDMLINGWYDIHVEVVVPFILKGHQSVADKPEFVLEELEKAAAFGQKTLPYRDNEISIADIAPDLVLADMGEKMMDFEKDLEIVKIVGQGGFGTVYLARFKGKDMAVKQVAIDDEMKTEAFRDFRREVALSMELKHENICSMEGVCLNPWCMVMEFLPFGDVSHFLKDSSIKVTWKMRMRMALDIARGMAYLHAFNPKIIHRDLKTPNTLVIGKDPDFPMVKVTDFGESVACATTYAGRDRLANPMWLAPEIMRNEDYTEKADVYSFGIILWELVSRQDPFSEFDFGAFTSQLEDEIIQGLRPTIPDGCPPEYVELMTDGWHGDPKMRPTFDEIVARLEDMWDRIVESEEI